MEKKYTFTLSEDIYKILTDKSGTNLDTVVNLALSDNEVLQALIKAMHFKNETFRYNCFKVLYRISEMQPLVLYPEWDFFVELLGSDNSYHRMAAIEILAILTTADMEKKFEKIFNRFYGLLDDKSMITAAYIARNSGKIAKAKPDLQSSIIDRLLDIDNTHHHQERKDLIKADAIKSLQEFFPTVKDKVKIINFVERQLDCSSPKTIKIAKEFLKKYCK